MNKEQHKNISEALARLNGEGLQSVTRAGSMGDFGFGDFIERETLRYNADKELVPATVTVTRLALHIDGCFRLTCGNEIILAKADMFEPTRAMENTPDFDWNAFDWDIRGGNRFDEIAGELLGENPCGFVVRKVNVSRWGDLKISFDNGFMLETFVDRSGSVECWRFFETGSDKHWVVTGQGIEDEETDLEM